MSTDEPILFKPKNIALLGGLLFAALILGEVVFHRGDGEMTAKVEDTAEDIAARIAPLVSFESIEAAAAEAAASAAMASMSPKDLYASACGACHDSGAAGAPKLGDVAGWQARVAKGIDALVSSAINGIGAMPARGGSSLDDDQIRSAVEYLLDESK